MARSILAAHDIPYFVHNGEYASLYPGIQMELLNVPTIMVPPSVADEARELLAAYLPEVLSTFDRGVNVHCGTFYECWSKRCVVYGLSHV
jgi:hypothetical protein